MTTAGVARHDVTARAELTVDPIACTGYGLCPEIAPELVVPDDWGFPIVESGGIPPDLLASASRAVRLCPRLALRIRTLTDRGQ
jgi:ferredoxin